MSIEEKLKTARLPDTVLNDFKNPSIEESDVCVLGVAFDATTYYAKGTWFGPEAIMAAFDPLDWEDPLFGIDFQEKVKTHFLGLLEYPKTIQNGKIQNWSIQKIDSFSEEMIQDVQEVTLKVLEQKKLLVSLGGEHSISIGVFNAIAKKFNPKKVTIIQLDAHPDLRENLNGLKHSHGSVMKHALDLGFPIIQIGVRDQLYREEINLIKEKKLASAIFPCPTMPLAYYPVRHSFLELENFLWNGVFSLEAVDRILNQVKTPFVYLTIDVDGFDPVFFPGVGTPLPFGLDLASAQDFLFRLFRHFKEKKIQVLGFDVVEVAPQLKMNVEEYNPLQTISTLTEVNAALLTYKLLLWLFLDRFNRD
ncbi:arginase family protein [Candidatus Micrarchaeota archaeon]|nr:arginase family protein [Candidatus Micrarchaeota archaeon]MBU1929909.1 arginase family protein [Candidatus Micrarchaeota archaeon]